MSTRNELELWWEDGEGMIEEEGVLGEEEEEELPFDTISDECSWWTIASKMSS